MNEEEMAEAAVRARDNAEEIKRLRERNHEFGNELQRAVAAIDNLGGKLDGTHASTLGRIAELRAEIREDLTEIKVQTTATNGRVGEHDQKISRIQGAVAALCFFVTVGAPVALFLVPHIH